MKTITIPAKTRIVFINKTFGYECNYDTRNPEPVIKRMKADGTTIVRIEEIPAKTYTPDYDLLSGVF